MPRAKNIIILGGSIGAVGTAHYVLRHVIKDLPDHKVILISPNNRFLWRPACPRAAVSETFAKDDRLLVDISKILQQYPSDQIQHIQGSATNVDTANNSVTVKTTNEEQNIQFDALVIATGASTPSPLLGLTEDEVKLQESWKAFQQDLHSAERIVIAGGGPAGIETAGELAELLNGRKSWFKSPKRKVAITVITSGSQILAHLRPAIAKTAETYLTEIGVEIMKNTKVQSVSPEDAGKTNVAAKATIQLDSGSTISADLYIPAIGTSANTSFMEKSLLAEDGRIKVNPSTLRVDEVSSHIYAIGDCSTYARPTVHSMFDAVPTLGANLKRDLLRASGKEGQAAKEDRKFVEDQRETQFVPIGSGKGVGAVMGWRLPSSLVSLAKGRNYLLWTTSGIITGKQWAKE